jgi:hypothetical protein
LLSILLASASKLKLAGGTGSLNGRGSAFRPRSIRFSHQAYVEPLVIGLPWKSTQFKERFLVAARTFLSGGVAGSRTLNPMDALCDL